MKTYNWNMSVQEAELLREQAALLRGQIAELDEQYGAASKSEKATITRAKKQLEAHVTEIAERLEGAPPPPVDPAKVVALAVESLGKCKKHYEELLESFLETARCDPDHAISWDAENLLVAKEVYSVVNRIVGHKEESNGGNWTLEDIFEVCEAIKEEARRKLSHYDPLNYSTSAFTNVCRAAQYKAHVKLSSDWDGISYISAMVGWREEAIAAWKQLQEEVS